MSDQNNPQIPVEPVTTEPAAATKPWYMKKGYWALAVVAVLVIGSASSQGSSDNAPSSETSQSSTDNTATEETDNSATEETTEEVAPEPEEPSMTVSQMNAVESAQSYLDYSAFSRKGLIEQLEFEDYTNADATFAVDYVNPDWNEQAAKSAEQYLDYSSFSRQGLIEQLVYEGFSQSQAEYGVNKAGL